MSRLKTQVRGNRQKKSNFHVSLSFNHYMNYAQPKNKPVRLTVPQTENALLLINDPKQWVKPRTRIAAMGVQR